MNVVTFSRAMFVGALVAFLLQLFGAGGQNWMVIGFILFVLGHIR